MKLHTQILLGMAVGAAVGLTLGPKSPWFPRDTFLISDLQRTELRSAPDPAATRLTLPQANGFETGSHNPPLLRAALLGYEYGPLQDARGKTMRRATWAKVQFSYGTALALLDTDDQLAEQLGGASVGSAHTAYLRIENLPLESGGFVARPEPVWGMGDALLRWLWPLGALFMKLIQMAIVPLVFSSLLVGIARLGDVRQLGRMGLKTLGLYLITTAAAISIGVSLATWVGPGHALSEATRAVMHAEYATGTSGTATGAAAATGFAHNLLAVVPINPFEALSKGRLLQVIFFAVFLGVALSLMGADRGTPVVDFFERLQQALVRGIQWIMAFAPIGVAALVADVVGQSGIDLIGALLLYAVTVAAGLLIHVTAVYGIMVRAVSKQSWWHFMKAARPPQLMAFSTCSSAVTLPLSMECAEKELGVSPSVSSFVLPLGATVNMDGTALYQGVAAVFVAQVFGMDLTLIDQLTIIGTATVASIGTASGPAAGMVTLAMVLTQAGIPTVGIALILGLDRILDMLRTAVNVTGDLAVTATVAAWEGESRDAGTAAG